jgi:hypothetical protein
MFIRLHHYESGKEFHIPANAVLVISIDTKRDKNKVSGEVKEKEVTRVVTGITMSNQQVIFEVRESPTEVATLVNEMLNTAARAARMN